MELQDDVARQFLAVLKSYAPVVLPTLLIFIIESCASLELWDAVRQLPHFEKETVPDDFESCINVEHMYQVRALREAAKKGAWRVRISQILFGLSLVIIYLLDQHPLSVWVILLMKGAGFDGLDGHVGSGADEESEFDGQSGSGYGWYYDSVLGQIGWDKSWDKSYFTFILFFYTVCFLARTLFLISGCQDRVVLRDTKRVPFIVVVRGGRFSSRRHFLVLGTVTVIQAILVAGAVWYHNSICIALVFASMMHFTICNFPTNKIVAFKTMVIASVFLVLIAMLWLLFGQLLSSRGSFLIHLLPLAHPTGDVNWNGLILTVLVCTGMFKYMSMCYRMDHAFARPDEFLVGSPDVRGTTPRSTLKLPGMRISYHSERRHDWPKPYFLTSMLSWLFAYALIAACTALGYIECQAEFAGIYAFFVAFPMTSLCILVCAVLRGEVKKVWTYKEDWAADPGCTVRAKEAIPEVVKEVEEEKVLIKVESDCKVPQA